MNEKVNIRSITRAPEIRDLVSDTTEVFFRVQRGGSLTTEERETIETQLKDASNSLRRCLAGLYTLGSILSLVTQGEIKPEWEEVTELGHLVEHLADDAQAFDIARDNAAAVLLAAAGLRPTQQ